MNLENLTQYNADHFYEMLGHLINLRRTELTLSLESFSESTGLGVKKLELIEKGQQILHDEELLLIAGILKLDETDLLKIAKITQVQKIMEITRELNAKFPE